MKLLFSGESSVFSSASNTAFVDISLCRQPIQVISHSGRPYMNNAPIFNQTTQSAHANGLQQRPIMTLQPPPYVKQGREKK